MARKRLASQRRCGAETIKLSKTHAQQWRDIGTAQNLSSDSDIAAFLFKVYEKSKADNSSPDLCIGCNQPLPRYLCFLCNTGSSLATSTPAHKGKKNEVRPPQRPSEDTEPEVAEVKVEREESEGDPRTRRRKRKTSSLTAADGEGDIVEVKVERVLSDDEDLKAATSEEYEGSILPILFDDKVDPSYEPPDNGDLTDEESDPTQKTSRKRKRGRTVKDSLPQKFECKHCSATFNQAYRLKRHSKIHAVDYGKDRLYSCEQCRMTFRLKGSLDAHMRAHSGQQLYLCAICNLSFTRAKQTKQHVLSQHVNFFSVTPCFKCAICQAEFILYKKFTTHIWRHTLERKFQCEHCPMAFFEQSSLRVHQRVHTGDKPFTCSECGLSFHQLSNLSRHILTHSGERPYQCTLCPATYPASQQLKRHMQSHRGEKPFLCQLCGASYTESKSLKFHIRSHTGEKPFKCDQCDKEFARPASLRLHKRTHSCDRPYICAICGATFADNSNLHRHHRLKHLGKPKKRQNGGGGGDGGGVVSGSTEPVSLQSVDVLSVSHHTYNSSNSSKGKSVEQHSTCSVLEMGVNGLVTNGISGSQGGVPPVGISGSSGVPVGSLGGGQIERLESQVSLVPASMMTYTQTVVPSVVPFHY